MKLSRIVTLALASIIIPATLVFSQGYASAQTVGVEGGGGGPITPVIPPVTPPVNPSNAPYFITTGLPVGVAGNRYNTSIAIGDMDKNDTLTLQVDGLNSTFILTNCVNKYLSASSTLKCTLKGKLDKNPAMHEVTFVARDSQGNVTKKTMILQAQPTLTN